MLFVRRTRHTLRSAEFGFFGVVVYTRRHTPRFCGHERSAGDAVRVLMTSLPRRISCCTVGIRKKTLLRPGKMRRPVLGEREGSRAARHVKRRIHTPLAMCGGRASYTHFRASTTP